MGVYFKEIPNQRVDWSRFLLPGVLWQFSLFQNTPMYHHCFGKSGRWHADIEVVDPRDFWKKNGQ